MRLPIDTLCWLTLRDRAERRERRRFALLIGACAFSAGIICALYLGVLCGLL